MHWYRIWNIGETGDIDGGQNDALLRRVKHKKKYLGNVLKGLVEPFGGTMAGKPWFKPINNFLWNLSFQTYLVVHFYMFKFKTLHYYNDLAF